MNCTKAQPTILELEDLRQLPDAVKAHVADCPDCHQWYQQLKHTERLAQEVPVPEYQDKDAFLTNFAQPGPAILPFVPNPPLANPPRKERGKQKLAAAFAMASALLICVIGWWLWPLSSSTQPGVPQLSDSLATRLGKNPQWQKARSPSERLTVLSHLSRQLVGEAEELAQRGSMPGLRSRARLFQELVSNGIIPEARKVAAANRPRLLQPLVDQMAQTESTAERLSAELPKAAVYLRQIAAAARAGERQLQQLITEATT